MVDTKCRHVLVLSLASMFLMGIFQTLLFIVVSVEGLKAQNMFSGIGFRCVTIMYCSIITMALFVPFFVYSTNPKITMFTGCATYMLFLLCLIRPYLEVLYVGSVIFGIGSVMLGSARGTYLVRNSTKKTISKHCAIYWTIIQISAFLGGIIVYIRFLDVESVDQGIRIFMIGILLGFSVVSFVFISLLPNYKEGYYLYKSKHKQRDYLRLFFEITRLLRSQIILVLWIPFFFLGFYIVFITVNFSLAVGHTTQLERPKEVSHFVGIFISLGEISGGFLLFISAIYLNSSYRILKITIGFVSLVSAHFMVFIYLPNEAADLDTDDTSVIEPSIVLIITTSFLLGIADSCFNTQIIESVALFYPRISALVFPVFQIIQALGSIAANIVSTVTALYGVLATLVGLSLITFICYLISETLVSDEDVIVDKFGAHTQRKNDSSDSSRDRSSRTASRLTTSTSGTSISKESSWSDISPTTSRSSFSTSEELSDYDKTNTQGSKSTLLSSARRRIINCLQKILKFGKGPEDQEETVSSKSVSSIKLHSTSKEKVVRSKSVDSLRKSPSKVSIQLPNSSHERLASKSSSKLSKAKIRNIPQAQEQPGFLQKLMSMPMKIPWLSPEGVREANRHAAGRPKSNKTVTKRVSAKRVPNAISVRNDSSNNVSIRSKERYGRDQLSSPSKGILRINNRTSSSELDVPHSRKHSSRKSKQSNIV